MLVGVAFHPLSFLHSGTQAFYIIERQNCLNICNRVQLRIEVCFPSQLILNAKRLSNFVLTYYLKNTFGRFLFTFVVYLEANVFKAKHSAQLKAAVYFVKHLFTFEHRREPNSSSSTRWQKNYDFSRVLILCEVH